MTVPVAVAANREVTERRAWLTLAIFFAAAVLSYTDRLILNLFVDPIRHDLAITDTGVSYLQGAGFAVIYAIVGLPLGRYADLHHRRNLAMAGIALWSCATAACGLAMNFHAFLVARIFVGIGESTLAPTAMSMIPDLFGPARRGLAIAIFLAGMTIGGGIALTVGGVLLGLFENGSVSFLPIVSRLAPWRAVLVFLALPGLLTAAAMSLVPEPARRERRTDATGDWAATARYFGAHRRLFAGLFGAFALLQLVDYGFNAWLPTLMVRQFRLAATEVGPRIGMVSIVCGFLGSLLGGLVADRFAAKAVGARLRVSVLGTAVMLPIFLFPLMGSPGLVLALYGAYALISAVANTAGLAGTQDAVPAEMRGFSVSLQAFVYTLFGLGAGPTIVAAMTEHLFRNPADVGAAMVATALPAGLAALVLLAAVLRPYAKLCGTLQNARGAP